MDWVALCAFEFTALVISRLQQRAQMKAKEALVQRRDSERLYFAAREMLQLDHTSEPGIRITPMIRRTFELTGVVLFDASTANTVKDGECTPEIEQGTRDAYFRGSDSYESTTGTWFCVLRVGVRLVGSLALRGATTMSPLMAQAISSLCAMRLEQSFSFEREAQAEAARQAEQLRTAVVEALAHQIKTPLCVIQAASSGLLDLGELTDIQSELLSSIDSQAAKLNDLVSRLLTTAALDNVEINPSLAPVMLSRLVRATVQGIEDPFQRERVQVFLSGDEIPALVDDKLMITVVRELLENALKYSKPGSNVTATVTASDTEITVTVHSEGVVVAPADRSRIFERFYRTQEARQARAGTGLGLSIVKRIVEAHHARIWVQSAAGEGTSFIVAVPKVDPGESEGRQEAAVS
jgi:two-component system sensor histidine kinase KdpD